jgi:hypothetical protein
MFSLSTSLHPDYLPLADATLTALVAAYPKVAFSGVEVYQPKGYDQSLGHVEDDRIVLNGYWFSEPRSKMDAAVIAAREATPPGFPRWHGGIGSLENEPVRLLTHEFGHILFSGITGYRAFADRLHRAALRDPAIAVSGYSLCADDGADECAADTFAAMRLGGSGSPQVAELQAFLEENQA